MGTELTHEGSIFLNFRHYAFPAPMGHGFRWVDAKYLRPPAGPASDRELLAAVVAHEQYRDDYAGGGVDPEGTRHGPYRLASVTPDAYEPLTGERGAQILRAWLGPGIPAELSADLHRDVFAPLTAADSVHHLRALGNEHFHDWGGVHGEFHEFVLVDRAAARVTLLVAADD
ncbi:hypothetical protein [Streptomyces sp. NPDC021020]|uniref:hypothetical protein n=1 Tax=Streptomyces sp. NPDC021020 TaxID=3365109 RepID=UPI00379B2BCE